MNQTTMLMSTRTSIDWNKPLFDIKLYRLHISGQRPMLAYAVYSAEYINIQTYMIMNGVYCAEQNSWEAGTLQARFTLHSLRGFE